MSPAASVSSTVRWVRSTLRGLSLCIAAAVLALATPAQAEPRPCGSLITVPKPPPVPFPNPKPAPLPGGSIGGNVVGTDAVTEVAVTLYRCDGNVGMVSGQTLADATGHFAFGGLDASYDYYVEMAMLLSAIEAPGYRAGAYAVPGMTEIAIGPQ